MVCFLFANRALPSRSLQVQVLKEGSLQRETLPEGIIGFLGSVISAEP